MVRTSSWLSETYRIRAVQTRTTCRANTSHQNKKAQPGMSGVLKSLSVRRETPRRERRMWRMWRMKRMKRMKRMINDSRISMRDELIEMRDRQTALHR